MCEQTVGEGDTVGVGLLNNDLYFTYNGRLVSKYTTITKF